MSQITVKQSSVIPGLLEIDLALYEDSRGSFKEAFQRQKLVEAGFPSDFEIVQNSVAINNDIGVTRGIHAEPWDKYITVSTGKIFVAYVDFRQGDNFGKVQTFELTPEKAIFLPKGVGNSYQTLSKNVVYSYLVNDFWSPDAKYTMCNLADKDLAIDWPIGLDEAVISDKDQNHPLLADIEAVAK